jgi:hypothetical protein
MTLTAARPSRLGLVFALAGAFAACGGGSGSPATRTAVEVSAAARAISPTERLLPLLPDGAQVVVEVDLARLRGNAVVGSVVTKGLAQLGADARLPGLPVAVQGSPLALADAIVLAAYGVGSDHAATITLVITKSDVPGGTRLADDLVVLAEPAWAAQVDARAHIAHDHAIVANPELLALRDHALPKGAAGATLRVTARLPFDARVALARASGVDTTPSRLSLWCDIADDFAVVIDADASDHGERGDKDAAKRLAASLRGVLASIADAPTVRALGVPNSIEDARLIAQGSWVRAVISIGPHHLARAAERAAALLDGGGA